MLEARQLTKRFPGVLALDAVSLSVPPGEVLAVIGENGAGKSTLMKILSGVEQPDAGEIVLDGQAVRFDSVRAALKSGIALIHQELNLSDNLDVAGNVLLGREPRCFGFVSHRRIHHEARPFLDQVGLDCSPNTLVSTLSIGRQQMVEIAKALSCQARILIMDEPTSSLTAHETEQLFRLVRSLRSNGVGVVYISHRLVEVEQIADRVVVLRDGRNVGELQRGEIEHDRMVRLMVGRDLAQFYQRRPHSIGGPVLEVENLRTHAHRAHELNFKLCAGEMVGLAGLVGAGRSELLQTLFGITKPAGGTARVANQPLSLDSPASAMEAGLALVPEDRKQQGLVLEMAVRANIALPSLCTTSRARMVHSVAADVRRLTSDVSAEQIRASSRRLLQKESMSAVRRGFFVRKRSERTLAQNMISTLAIRPPRHEQPVQLLSGGNQQKVVLAKWLALKPRVLLLDEPTRGVDVGAKREIYTLMERLAEQGIAILFVSSEMAEIIGMSDRVLVMHQGRLTGELARDQLTEEAIMRLATGRTESLNR